MGTLHNLHPDTEWVIECPECGSIDWRILTPDGGETYLDVSGYRCAECGYEVEIDLEE